MTHRDLASIRHPVARLREELLYDPETGAITRRDGKAQALHAKGVRCNTYVYFMGMQTAAAKVIFALTQGRWPDAMRTTFRNGNAADLRLCNLKMMETAPVDREGGSRTDGDDSADDDSLSLEEEMRAAGQARRDRSLALVAAGRIPSSVFELGRTPS